MTKKLIGIIILVIAFVGMFYATAKGSSLKEALVCAVLLITAKE